MKIPGMWLIFTALATISSAALAQTTTLTFGSISPAPVIYDPDRLYSVNVNLTASQQTPTIVAQTSGPVNACRIESVSRTLNTASVKFSTQGATSSTTTCRIIVTQPGEGNIADASGTLLVNIGKADQVITAIEPENFLVGEERPIYFESVGSANPILVSVGSTSCPLKTSSIPWQITGVKAGECSFFVKKAGDANYHDFPKPGTPNSPITVSIGRGNTAITFVNPPDPLAVPFNQSYNLTVTKTGSPLALSGGTTTGPVCTVVVPNSSASSLIFTIQGHALGTCTVNANVAGNNDYNGATKSISIQIVKINQILTLTRSSATNLEVNQTEIVTVTTSHPGNSTASAAPVLVSVANPTLCTISGTGPYTIRALKSGTCQVNATQAGDSLYNAGASSLAIPINKLPQTLSVSGVTSFEVGHPVDLTINPGVSGNLPKLSVEDTSVCRVTVSSSTLARLEGLRFGTCTIRGEHAEDATYRAFPLQTIATITVNRSTSLIQFNYVPVVSVDKPDFPRVTPIDFVTFASTTPGICSISTDATSNKQIVTGLHVGQCKITATRPTNEYYVASGPIEQTFAVSQGAQTITPAVPTSLTLGTPVSISANSVSGSGQQLTVSASPSGICSLTPIAPTNSNHAQATVSGSAAGDCSITFVQNGTVDYAPSSLTVVSRVIAPQTISFAPLSPVALNAGPLTLQALASSGLQVSFTSTTPAICSVTGNELALLKVGTCSLTASQAGNAYHLPSPPVTQNLTVLLPTSTATVISSANPVPVRRALNLTASVGGALPTGNVSFLANGVAIVGCELVALQSGTATCTTSALKPGLHQIVASYSGDANNQGSQSAALAQRVIGLDWLVPVLDLLQN